MTTRLFKYQGLSAIFLIVTLAGCASLPEDWQLNHQQGDLQYFTRQSTEPSLPEFRTSVIVQAPINEVMMLITDFSRHPEWVYGCKKISVIALKDYTEAYLYQVTALPVIRDRDMILHARTFSENNGEKIRIQLDAAPLYCDNNDDEDCEAIRNSSYIRVNDVQGAFILSRLSSDTTQIEWTQFVDPAGALPHWMFRAALSQVPIKSLQRLKSLVESRINK